MPFKRCQNRSECGTAEKFRCDALRDLVPFLQFKKREKRPWRSITFSEVAA